MVLLLNTLALAHALTKQIIGAIADYAGLRITFAKSVSGAIVEYASLRTYYNQTNI